jgi:hypothetical protein
MKAAAYRLALFISLVGLIIACDNPTAPRKKLTPPPPDTSRHVPPHDTLVRDTTGG